MCPADAARTDRAGVDRYDTPAPRRPFTPGPVDLARPPGSSRSPRSPRELMVTLWYPARPTHGRARAPWLPPEAAALYKQKVDQQLHTSLDPVDLPLTHAYANAAVEESGRGLPVVLFSPGYRAQRAPGTALVEDLASRGHAVVTIDHTHESGIVEFPGGRLGPGRQPARPTRTSRRRCGSGRTTPGSCRTSWPA
ncbi:hypothetical protein [Streptomyces sp. NPDC056105]|uniref:alpha/beta hydrolase n=1 Tax=Streptomyces sp. NPDC056105 TaxID=3345714 RepID=UPI0035D92E02